MPPLGTWLMSFLVPSLLSIVATFWILRWKFRKELSASIDHPVEAQKLNIAGKLVLFGLAIMVIVLLIASFLGRDLGLPTCLAAVAVTAVVKVKARSNPLPLVRGISWETLALVTGLFVMVDAMQSIGAMQKTSEWLIWAEQQGAVAGTFIIGFAVGVANNLVNNLPLGLLAGSTVQAAHATGLVSDAVLIGVDLGPNLSITGSLATIL